jgi:small subunit ribosomal protein S19e
MIYLDVNPQQLIKGVAKELHGKVQPPEWAPLVKTGAHKERPPMQADWWYVRSAAILRTVAILGPVGTNKLKVKYGGIKNRGHKPNRFTTGSGNIIRKSLQQLESAGLIEHKQIGNHKGRVITPAGVQLLNKVAKVVKVDTVSQKEAVLDSQSQATEKAKKTKAAKDDAKEAAGSKDAKKPTKKTTKVAEEQ